MMPSNSSKSHTAQIMPGISIREVRMKDAAEIWDAIDLHREYLRTWLPFVDGLKSADNEKEFLSSVLSESYEERNLVFMIGSEGKLCGLVGFVGTEMVNYRTEIGYWLLPEYQGRGIMTRCVHHLCRWAVRKRNINRIQIRCAAGNHSSNAIPQRLGFRLEGTERQGQLLSSGEYTDINVYSILKSEVITWKTSI